MLVERSPHSVGPMTRPVRALVRFAAAIAQGYEPELRERIGPLRASQVPAPWVEELLLQSVLMVGYPRALIAFAVWRHRSSGLVTTAASGMAASRSPTLAACCSPSASRTTPELRPASTPALFAVVRPCRTRITVVMGTP